MKVEEQSEGYREIPGLPEPDRGGKKGKKKNNSKKTLNLPIFTEANGKNAAALSVPPVTKPPKPQLSDKEVAILDSCHSYIHDYLKISGPMSAFDARLQAEINQFPPEAKGVMNKVGGLKAFILLCENLFVVDKIVGAKIHTAKVKELALKDVYNSMPSAEKQIWNTTSPQHSKVGISGDSSQVPAAATTSTSNKQQALQSNSSGNVLDSQLEALKSEILRLTNQNKELNHKLTEKDSQIQELRQNVGRITQLELETKQARIQIIDYREQIERLKTELAELKSLNSTEKQKSFSDNDRDLVISLQKQLEAEKLRNLNLTQQQLENQLPGLSLNGQSAQDKQNVFAPLNRQNSFVNLGQVESDPLGLRNMSINSGGLELKSTPNMFGAIGSDFGKRLAAAVSKPDQMPGLGSHLAPGSNTGLHLSGGSSSLLPGSSSLLPGSSSLLPVSSSLLPGSSSLLQGGTSLLPGSGLLPSGSGSGNSSFNLMKSGSASTLTAAPGSRGPSPASNFTGFSGGLGGMAPFSSFSSGQLLQGGSSCNLLPGGGIGLGSSLAPGGSSLAGNLAPGGQSSLAPGSSSSHPLVSSSVQSLVTGGGGIQTNSFSTHLNSSTGMHQVSDQFGLNHHLSSHPVQVGGSTSELGSLQSVMTDTAPQLKSNSAIRQEQLIKKLVATIPGSDQDTIKHYIQVLRDRHGKLSGWSTNKITQEILQLVHEHNNK